MRRILFLLAALLGSAGLFLTMTNTRATVSCSLPFNLQNNTTADATQVMANYNAIVTCLGNAASAGANTDITALLGLSTPLAPSAGGTSNFFGGTSTGTANAQVVAAVTPTSFTLTTGYQVGFFAGFSNTAAMTLNVNSTGAKSVFRPTQLGALAVVGGEVTAGAWVVVVYDGTEFVLLQRPVLIGEFVDWSTATAPAGVLFAGGGCQLRATYAPLFSVIGTAYDPTGSTCDGTHFAMPDFRARLVAYKDDMGGGVTNRITTGGSSCDATIVGGAGCGTQSVTLTLAQVPTGNTTFNDATHIHSLYGTNTDETPARGLRAGGTLTVAGQLTGTPAYVTANTPAGTDYVGASATGASVTDHAGGGAHPVLNPLQIITKGIRY